MGIKATDVVKLPDNCHTYDEWMERGYVVKRGQKSIGRIMGKPVFSSKQVKEYDNYYFAGACHGDDSDFDDEDYGPSQYDDYLASMGLR